MFDMFLQKNWNFDHPDPSLGPLTGFPRYLSRFSAWSRPEYRGNQWKTKGNAQNPSFSKAFALENDGFWVQTPHRCKAKYVCKGGWEELYFLVFWWTFCGFWWTFGCFLLDFHGFWLVLIRFSMDFHGFCMILVVLMAIVRGNMFNLIILSWADNFLHRWNHYPPPS